MSCSISISFSASVYDMDSSPEKGYSLCSLSLGYRASRLAAIFASSYCVASSSIDCIRSSRAFLSSADMLSSKDCACAIWLCRCSINSSRFCGGWSPKKSPNCCMNLSKSGSSPLMRCSSIWFIASTRCLIAASDSASMSFIRCVRSRVYDCSACLFSISISSWNFCRASSSMKS